ncbi:MAG TPA: hypothetical protein VEO00_04635 [Actinomycetota bacterium]|nr:hypothetical protein [Actinomycetota bacterium]
MSVKAWLAMALAAGVTGAGIASLVRSLGNTRPGDSGRLRALIVLHDVARAGFWFGLAAFFTAYALADDPDAARGILIVPLALAGVRLLTAQALARSLPPD